MIVQVPMKQLYLNKSKMLVAGQKRKHFHKTLREKAQALKNIWKKSNKEVAAKYYVSKNTISTWVKK